MNKYVLEIHCVHGQPVTKLWVPVWVKEVRSMSAEGKN